MFHLAALSTRVFSLRMHKLKQYDALQVLPTLHKKSLSPPSRSPLSLSPPPLSAPSHTTSLVDQLVEKLDEPVTDHA